MADAISATRPPTGPSPVAPRAANGPTDTFAPGIATDPTLKRLPPMPKAPPTTPLTRVLRDNFSRWSQGKDSITPADVYRELGNPANTGDAAAAVAFLACQEDGCGDSQSLTIDDIKAYEASGSTDWDSTFAQAQGNLKAETPDLMPSGKPELDDLSQGWMSDCFDMAAIGGTITLRPPAVFNMVSRNDDGYTVTFPGWPEPQKVVLTQAEEAYFGSGQPKGRLQMVLEKAAAQIQVERARAAGDTENFGDPLYALARIPGYPSNGITLMTGHAAVTCGIRPDVPDGHTPTQAQMDDKLAALRIDLTAYTGQAVVVATSDDTYFGGRHDCTVLGYDEKTDTIQLWNPWGVQNAMPDLVPGEHGTFTMKLADFQKHFLQVTFEEPDQAATLQSTPFTLATPTGVAISASPGQAAASA